MSANVWESAHIALPIQRVWPLLRNMEFVWNPRIQSTRTGADRKSATTPWGVGEIGVVNYVDGTSQDLRLTELSDSHFRIGWEVVSSTPEVSYGGVNHSIQLRRVTESNTTFITWEGMSCVMSYVMSFVAASIMLGADACPFGGCCDGVMVCDGV